MAADEQTTDYLKTLEAVRAESQRVYVKATEGKLKHFEFDPTRIPSVCDYIESLITRDYGAIAAVPPHGRWRSYKLDAGQRDLVSEHIKAWKASGVDQTECTRRVVDLFVISVLIDAGAGESWKYTDVEFGVHCRTEGLGLAALRMFEAGAFSNDPANNPHRADALALEALSDDAVARGFQVSEPENPLLGCANRAELLRRLGHVLSTEAKYFGSGLRPGSMVDYLQANADGGVVDIDVLWEVIIDGLAGVWPASRSELGDVWTCDTLDGARVPFHKLSQWLCWSLVEAIQIVGGLRVARVEKLTGLPEYRNGGVFIDMGVLSLRNSARARGLAASRTDIPEFAGHDPVIVEWRAMTVALLDRVAETIKARAVERDPAAADLGMFLARVLEGGTWKAGRELAARLRPDTRGPPINTISDGTLF